MNSKIRRDKHGLRLPFIPSFVFTFSWRFPPRFALFHALNRSISLLHSFKWNNIAIIWSFLFISIESFSNGKCSCTHTSTRLVDLKSEICQLLRDSNTSFKWFDFRYKLHGKRCLCVCFFYPVALPSPFSFLSQLIWLENEIVCL